MPVKKSELYSSLWKSCDELRGGMDASQYKDYVLVLLFVKYVSDKAAAGRKGSLLEVPPGGGFADMVKLKSNPEIGDKMNKVIGKLAETNDLKGVIDVADWNDPDKLGKGKEMVDRLTSLVAIFEDEALDFRSNRAEGDDLLGDAYEFLLQHFATQSGKSKGQFATPAEVSRIIAKVIGAGGAKSANQSIYDPTCGSGSLLIKAHDEAKSVAGLDLAVYGQEMDNATYALARMNLILHDCPTAEVWKDNTLSSPYFKDPKTGALKTFDFVVANPPFSTKAWSHGFDPAEDVYRRFKLGVPPPKNGDYAFLLHVLASLKSTGKGAIILPHGVLFRGGAEATIRRELVRLGYLKGIIGLPPNLFYGTGIPACILVLDKEGAGARKGIFMIDASKAYIKDGNKNRLRAQDIHKIVDVFNRQATVPRYSRLVPLAEIADAKNDFNLNLPRYIDTSEPEDIQDIAGHLRGGIPDRDLDALESYWKVFPNVREALFKNAGRPGYNELKVPAADIKATIFGHPEFKAWSTRTRKLFTRWRESAAPQLAGIRKGDSAKKLIDTLSEELLAAFEKAKLLDAYDVYQHLMDYWAEVLQDDVYAIVGSGWKEAAALRQIAEEKEKDKKDKKDQKMKETPDLVVGKGKYKADLIPPGLVVARYFADEQAAIEKLEAAAAAAAQSLEELAEEHGGEEGLLADARNEKDKLTKASVTAQLRSIEDEDGYDEERVVLRQYLTILEEEAGFSSQAKAATATLTAKVAAKYGKLTVDEIKTLVVEDKWLAAIEATVGAELQRTSEPIAGRLRNLAERYSVRLPLISKEVHAFTMRVDGHLKKMGISW